MVWLEVAAVVVAVVVAAVLECWQWWYMRVSMCVCVRRGKEGAEHANKQQSCKLRFKLEQKENTKEATMQAEVRDRTCFSSASGTNGTSAETAKQASSSETTKINGV